ncbi:transcription factor EMB1444-like isoform X3 [Vigna unguiculata]|uniref:transcription factor EMB1444-like isoform X3 n=1 Tax=Vigna unguiculata TaxID=3917 RepID=UPI001016E5A4|nr:transcription factor EMB1444-like isoform X3 [Vigna unguiculata]
MGNNLHQVLRSLCFNTHWNYAIFWKLKHRARMILTWEDAYYNNPDDYDSSENKHCQNILEQIGYGKFSHNALGLAVAKMSYHAYSLGEGIVGQVAVTGKHRWICADNQVAGSGLSFEFADGWQSQFSAGIRTIAVVAVAPLGVIQLGSLNKQVIEDMGFVTHIRNLFLSTQNCPIAQCPSQVQGSLKSSLSQKMSDNVAKQEGPELYSDESSILLQSISNMMNVEHHDFKEMKPLYGRKCEEGSSGCKDVRLESENNVSSFLSDFITDNDLICPSDKVRVDSACFPSAFLDTVVCETDKLHCVDNNQKGVLNFTQPSDANSQHVEKPKFGSEPSYNDMSNVLNFPAGCELHEALGPSFLKGSKSFDWPAQLNQDMKTVEMSDEISTSQLTSESRPEHLLEAMVANISHSNNDVNSELSFCTSMQSAMASAKNHEASTHNVYAINSEGYSIDQFSLVKEDKHHSLSSSSGICGVMSSKGVSSTFPSSSSGQLERSSEPSKNSKKRARPGESCRPRPRDRQLIQDRIKELRELVPNGAKCSIDSLLERAIKHMLFLQSITKHADKLTDFGDTKSKLHHMEADILGSSSYEQGSSWAMEVGGHLKVHSILVENLSKNGQMLVEMLCEECSHFLEIAEAIRSLGLTILKGGTKVHGEKIWICFVVEGQNNRNVHRLDILWPLVQILQSKSTVYSQ